VQLERTPRWTIVAFIILVIVASICAISMEKVDSGKQAQTSAIQK
jgi:hypothetical protein